MPRPERFDPLGFLRVATDLAASGGEERLRTAVGRAYYALFLLAREKTGAYPTSSNESAHATVIRAVRRRKGFALGNQRYQIKELRLTADVVSSASCRLSRG